MNGRWPVRWPDPVRRDALAHRSSPASKRQVFGWQAKRDTAEIGALRIEIEGDVGIDSAGIAKLPLQGAAGVQSPRAARREQQRHRFGAEIDRIGPVAPRS